MFWLFLLTAALAAYLVYRNYQLEKRWRSLRYCWHTMSDFAGEALRSPDGDIDAAWTDVVREHQAFMRQFGVPVLAPADLELYEAALLERQIPPLVAHRPAF